METVKVQMKGTNKMEKEVIKTVGNFDISFIIKEERNPHRFSLDESSFLSRFIEINNLEEWNHTAGSQLIRDIEKQFISLLLKIVKFNDSEDIYEQADLERGCKLALEHLLDLINDTSSKISENIKAYEHKNDERAKAKKAMETHYNKKVKPSIEKLHKELSELNVIAKKFDDAPRVEYISDYRDLMSVIEYFTEIKYQYNY